MDFNEHLKESGLTRHDAKKLRWKDLSANQVYSLVNFNSPGFLIPYFDLNGKLIKEIYRVRFYNPVNKNTGKPGRPKKIKYIQPSGIRPYAYFSPMVKWSSLLKDTSTPIFITEGEKKAAKACKEGFPTVGLGGVWNFMSKDLNIELLPELKKFDLTGRVVFIVFDSDARENKDIRKAIKALTDQLVTRGAEVKLINLPPDGEYKVGIDDYLVEQGAKSFEKLIEEAANLTPNEEELSEYNERYILVVENSGIYDLVKNRLQSQRVFKDARPDEFVTVQLASGRISRETKATVWLDSANKQKADAIVVEPYGVTKPVSSRITDKGDLNVFRGYGHTPKRGTTKPWRDLLNIVFMYNKDLIPWFEQWLAYPLQNPGAKLNTAVFVYGGQGIGKSALGLLMLDIYGDSGIHIQDSSLFSNFNKWMEGALFVMGDDLAADHVKKSRSILKDLVGGETVLVEPKGIDAYKVRNLANFYMTANQASALPLDPSGSNRRFLVINAPTTRPVPKSWYTKTFNDWRKKQEGARYTLDRLLKIDCRGFNPFDDAPDTEAKNNVVRATEMDVDGWTRDVEHNAGLPDDLYDINSIYKIYQAQTGDTRTRRATLVTSLTQFAESLGQIYFSKNEGQLPTRSIWAIRNKHKYIGKDKVSIAKAYQNQIQGYTKHKNRPPRAQKNTNQKLRNSR